jgi:hypothetical protein
MASSTDSIDIQPALASRLRNLLDRWLPRFVPPPRPRVAAAARAPRTLADLGAAWLVAEVECTIALRAWQLADRGDKATTYDAYRRALEREAALAASWGRRLRLQRAGPTER